MPKIYLINVGANTAHLQLARSPIFNDDTFVYISFPDEEGRQVYSAAMRRFLSPECPSHTHLDPDWDNKTYGDNCKNPRARALLNAEQNDILLFWALLWRNTGDGWTGWLEGRGWYLIGAIRIEEILEAGDSAAKAEPKNQERASYNAHIIKGKVAARPNRVDRVFIGSVEHSRRFQTAVDLEIGKARGLFHRTVRTSDGREVNWNASPRWNSVTRSCRAVWDLSGAAERQRACLLRNAIRQKNSDFDLLAGL